MILKVLLTQTTPWFHNKRVQLIQEPELIQISQARH